MNVQWIRSAAEFDSIHEEWNALLAASEADSVFLSWEWLRTWWNQLGGRRELRIAALRRNGQLVGLAPLTVRPGSLANLSPFPVVEFLGSGTVGSDYLDLIVREGDEAEALDEIADAITRAGLMLELNRVKGSGSLVRDLARRMKRRGWPACENQVTICPFIDLRGHSWPSYLASLSSEHRYNVQRKTKSLSKNFEVTFLRADDEPSRRTAIRLLISLHQERWKDHGTSDAFHTQRHISFHEEFTAHALRRGWLRLYTLCLNGQPASSLYGLRYGRTFSFYQSGFDPSLSRYSVGLVTMAMAIQQAIEEGAEEFDFLHGAESYKFHWAKQFRDLTRIELYPPGVLGRGLRAVTDGRHSIGSWWRSFQPGGAEALNAVSSTF
jgi:CelD/BcsL family acetyltransferase involved in cellulose biosynthesis